MLRRRRPAGRLRRGQPEHLREPLRRGPGGRAGAPLRLEPQRAGRARRNLSVRQLVRRRHRVRAHKRQQLPERVPWRALLRRLLARLHLGDASRRERRPRPGTIRTFAAGAANPVYLQIGPGGDLFYPDFDGGTIRRVTYTSTNQPPIAAITASPTTGPAPLTVSFDGTGSSDPEGRDAELHVGSQRRRNVRRCDRRHRHAHLQHRGHLYRDTAGHRQPGRDRHGLSHHHRGQHTPDRDHRRPSGRHNLEGRRRHRLLRTRHRPTGRHAARLRPHLETDAAALPVQLPHPRRTRPTPGVAGGSFTAPDHEYPSYLELELTATDSGGLTNTKTIRLDPRTVTLTFSSVPGGLQLTVGSFTGSATFTRTVIVGSANTVSPSHRRPREKRRTASPHGPTAARRPIASPLRRRTPPTQPASDKPRSRRCPARRRRDTSAILATPKPTQAARRHPTLPGRPRPAGRAPSSRASAAASAARSRSVYAGRLGSMVVDAPESRWS